MANPATFVPLLHGTLGWFDEIALVVIGFVVLGILLFASRRRKKKKKNDSQK